MESGIDYSLKKSSGKIAVNTQKRSLKQEGVLSACIITGTDKVRNGFGNGDCLLCDFNHGVFAVADASERYPQASRELLERLADLLARGKTPCSDKDLQNYTQNIYEHQKYNYRSTFSCIAATIHNKEPAVSIVNGGDSMIIIVDASDGSIKYQTGTDMKFAGRSRQIPEINTFKLINPNLRIIIATDGFNDILYRCNGYRSENNNTDKLPVQIVSVPPHQSIDQLYHLLNSNKIEYDDIGIIVIDPFHLHIYNEKSVIFGGTTPKEELTFNEGFKLRAQ